MFSQRRNSQKPDEELYSSFKQTFPEITAGTSSALLAPSQRPSTLSEALIAATPTQREFEDDNSKEQDATSKPAHEAWRLTPSLMDPNSFAFSSQPPGYYTPTPNGYNTLYHNQAALYHSQAGDLHTPAYAPHQFLQHQDSGFTIMDDTPSKKIQIQQEMALQASGIHPSMSHGLSSSNSIPGMTMGKKFRFHTTLNAPTAMVKHADEIPITYLNKGQAYTLSIFDTAPPMPQQNVPVRYRTYVRVSFEDEQQRARPGACWQLWKEGRGSNEAHQRGGKLLAVEYVYPSQGGEDGIRKSQVELEKAAFDGFAVTWYPNHMAGVPDCSISVRFNFLSTDFSHSKGVKGIPVRLCAKTELISPLASSINEPEVCFSKVKLFRDHGAERKLSNDVSHVKKTIEKLKQQIAQAESGLSGSGKRKRSGSVAVAKTGMSKAGKVVKHKRTWSVDADAEAGRPVGEEDMHIKLTTMQDMFSSTRPVSVLFLPGEPEDDPDLHPVKLPGGESVEPKALNRSVMWDSHLSTSDSPTSNPVSPTNSSTSQPTPKRKFSDMQQGSVLEEAQDEFQGGLRVGNTESPRPVKIMRLESEMKPQSDILAFDVDSSYQPPLDRPIKPVACFYVRGKDDYTQYYRAVYLMRRTVRDLITGISRKFQIDPTRVTQVTHVNTKGLHIVVDEDVVREVPEGQDMLVEFSPAQADGQVKQEFATPADSDILADGIIDPEEISAYDPLEMWLNY
ncbi:hypothetical protein DV735_g5664, partial [Chaetothyriales sp. CBS 134920]